MDKEEDKRASVPVTLKCLPFSHYYLPLLRFHARVPFALHQYAGGMFSDMITETFPSWFSVNNVDGTIGAEIFRPNTSAGNVLM